MTPWLTKLPANETLVDLIIKASFTFSRAKSCTCPTTEGSGWPSGLSPAPSLSSSSCCSRYNTHKLWPELDTPIPGNGAGCFGRHRIREQHDEEEENEEENLISDLLEKKIFLNLQIKGKRRRRKRQLWFLFTSFTSNQFFKESSVPSSDNGLNELNLLSTIFLVFAYFLFLPRCGMIWGCKEQRPVVCYFLPLGCYCFSFSKVNSSTTSWCPVLKLRSQRLRSELISGWSCGSFAQS